MTFSKPTNTEWMEAVEWASRAPDDFNRKPLKIGSFAELIDTFPDAIPAARRAINARIKMLKRSESDLNEFRAIWDEDLNKIHHTKRGGYTAYLNDLVDRLNAAYEKELKRCQYQLEYLDTLGKPQEENKPIDPITPARIERARQVPIDEMIEVNRSGNALCLFHNDRHPSMKVYPDNHVYCYACARKEDAIGVYMALHNVDFRTAVRALAP